MINVKRPDVAEHFVKFFLDKGFTANGIAGAAGNICEESGFAPNNLQNSYNSKWKVSDEEYTALVNTGLWEDPITSQPFAKDKAGYGLCQWTSEGRKQGLLNLAYNRNSDIDDELVQFLWLLQELQTVKRYKNVYETLQDPSKSIEDCAGVFVCEFEVPKAVINGGTDKANCIAKRAASAKEFYETYVKKYVKEETMSVPVIAINAGHWNGNPKGVPSSMPVLKNVREFTLNHKVVCEVVRILRAYNVKVVQNYDVTGNDGNQSTNGLNYRIAWAEKEKANIYLSIHHNGGINGGTGGGTSVFCYNSAKNKEQATRIHNHIVAHTGLKGNRSSNGVYGKNDYQEVWQPSMDSFIIECGFMDSVTDIYYIAQEQWATNVALGIVDFLIEEFKLSKKVEEVKPEVKPAPIPIPQPTTTAGEFKVKAEETIPIYNETGSYAAKGIYTIVEEKNGMGKLKSGMGWIPLGYVKIM